MEDTTFNYFYANENEQYLFLQMPLMLIKDDQFKKLSGDAKILYSLFLNRTSLSVKNGWHDDENRVYIIYTIDEIMNDLNCYQGKANKSMKELKDIGLIKTVRQGLTKPNLIYVMNFATDLKCSTKEKKDQETTKESLNCDFRKSGIAKIENQELRKSQTSNINHNKNNIRDIEIINQNQIYMELESNNSESDFIDMIDTTIIEDIINTPESIAERLHITELKTEYKDRRQEVELIYDIIHKTYEMSDNQLMRISKQSIPVKNVKQIYNSLSKEHIEYVLDNLDRNGNKYNIKTIMPYITTSLFQAARTIIYKKDKYFSEPIKNSSFDINDFFRKAIDKSMNEDG